jgi:outer membrane lipoprotein LolB
MVLFNRLIAGLGLVLWLSACNTPPQALSAQDAAQQAALAQLPSWSGRLGLRIDSEPVQAHSAGFLLRGNAERGELSLFTPLGTTLYLLEWTPSTARLHANGKIHTAANVSELSERATGSAIPVAEVFDWLAGRPTPQSDWQVDSSQSEAGRWVAVREQPAPRTVLRIVLDR